MHSIFYSFLRFSNWTKIILLFFFFLQPSHLFAHVKWFSSFDFLEKSKSIQEITDFTFWILSAFSILVILLFLLLDRKIQESRWHIKLDKWLDQSKKYGHYTITIATFVVLFMAWANDTVLTPELKAPSQWVIWFQFFLSLLVIIPTTTRISGVLLIALYSYAVFQFGFFYMLDYVHFVGIGIYLATRKSQNTKLRNIAIPSLYISLGFSLIWLALEKLFFPTWSSQLLEQYPVLALGFSHDFFIKGAAFVELGLGFVMLLGIVPRFLAVLISLVFILTSLSFGKIEIIGHTSLHAMLILFILTGTQGAYPRLIKTHWNKMKKIAIAGLSYLILITSFLFIYKTVADKQYHWALNKAKMNTSASAHCSKMVDVSHSKNIPTISLMEVLKEPMDMGYNLHVIMKNWKFTPEKVGETYQANQGHIHVYIDGKKAGRMYSDWFYLGKLSKGVHKIAITINGDDHTAITLNNKMIGEEKKILVE